MNFTIILSFILIWFIQIEASNFEAKMSEELGMCNENMAVVFQSATDLTTKYNKLKRGKR